MPRTRPKARRRAKDIATLGFWEGLKEVSLFFQGKDEVHKSMRRIAKRLEKAGIPYAIVCGMAVFFHKYRRTTADVDVLLTRDGLAEFRAKFVAKNYRQKEARPRRFVDKVNKVGIDFLVTGLFPGPGRSGPIAYPDPSAVGQAIEKVQIVNLKTLVELKLAARRYQDFADVVNLIRFNDLAESFAEELHPSVRQDYVECLEEKRREDEYEARETEP